MVTPGAKREAVAHAREQHGLSERRIASSSMPLADAHTRSAYAARLWLCLALTRSKLPMWVSVAVKASAAAYGEHALVRTEEAR